ncbi:hypothetical protein ACFOY2_52145 [Nonomuraea purpurea]|uniref:Uncharacterized protein n=1 Tax=Nonomuraea purpurea TaxID=1849276 RepID=A0ABV8GS96_9ACTN
MLTTRTTRFSRPARRPMTHAVLVLVLLVCAVFTHGGACAAVELSEPTAHGAGLGGRAAHSAGSESGAAHGVSSEDDAAHGVGCLHHGLPVRHQHGTEQDCSAISPVHVPMCVTMAAACSLSASESTAEAPASQAHLSPFAPSCRENLCVMRL